MIQMWSNIMVRDFTINIHHQIIFRQSDMRGYEGAGEPTVTKNLTKINIYKILTWKLDWMNMGGLGLIWIQIDHQPDATIFQFIILTLIYSSTCFGRFPAHHQELNGPTTNTARLSPRYEGKTRGCYCCHWAPDDGQETPETCWAVNKRQDNKLKHCCIWLVIYLNCTMKHGLTNLKLIWIVVKYAHQNNITKEFEQERDISGWE
jgi:hypothetical protein